MKRVLIAFVLLLAFNVGFADVPDSAGVKAVEFFIELIKNDDIDKLKTMVNYPIRRTAPIPDIKTQEDFERRYSEVFDDTLKNLIISSNPKDDWSEMGWRGIMYSWGIVWIDVLGGLVAVNYDSKFEEEKIKELIKKAKETLHPSLKFFWEPVLIMETKKFRVRIDKVKGGDYRYASWSINSDMSQKPDLIIEKGEVKHEGTGGNHSYTFVRGEYTYICDINVIGKTSTPAFLVVYHNGKEILNQPAYLTK